MPGFSHSAEEDLFAPAALELLSPLSFPWHWCPAQREAGQAAARGRVPPCARRVGAGEDRLADPCMFQSGPCLRVPRLSYLDIALSVHF